MTNEAKGKKLVLGNLHAFNIAALFTDPNKENGYRDNQKGVLIGPGKSGKGTMFYGTDSHALAMVYDESIDCEGYFFVNPISIQKAKIELGNKKYSKATRLEIENGVCTVFDDRDNSLVVDALRSEQFWNIEKLFLPVNKFIADYQSDKKGFAVDVNKRLNDEFDEKEYKTLDTQPSTPEMRVPMAPFYIDTKYYGKFAKAGEILSKLVRGTLVNELLPLYKRYTSVYFTMPKKDTISTMFVVMECTNFYKNEVESAKSVVDNMDDDYKVSELN